MTDDGGIAAGRDAERNAVNGLSPRIVAEAEILYFYGIQIGFPVSNCLNIAAARRASCRYRPEPVTADACRFLLSCPYAEQ